MESSSRTLGYSVSVISTGPTNFFDSLPLLVEGGVDRIHVDVMDGEFVPRFGLYPELVGDVRSRTELPIDVHMMVRNPEPYVDVFADAGATRLVPHVEPVEHLHRLVARIADKGLEVGLALNPHTTFAPLTYLVQNLSSVTLMGINPGIRGHKAIPNFAEKVVEFGALLDSCGYGGDLEIDGGVTFANVVPYARAGASLLVVGAGTVFSPHQSLQNNLMELNSLRDEREEVA